MTRTIMTSLLAFTMLTGTTPPPLDPPTQRPLERKSSQGLCRTAPGLPVLAAERVTQDEGNNARYKSGGPSVAMSAPPPPPPPVVAPVSPAPPAPSGSARDADEGGEDVIVTATRRVESRMDSPSAVSVVGGERIGEAPPPPAYAPPPPPPAPDSASAKAEGRVIMPPRPPYPKPQPRPQAGQLTAGDHDDLLNPELYARYVKNADLGQRIRDLPTLDTGRLLTVRVADASGRAVPFADIIVTCADGNSLSMKAHADGTAAFFPALDRLGSQVKISARRDGRSLGAARSVTISDAPGAQIIGITSDARATAVQKFDLMLVVDTTGSMGDEIRYLQSELQAILASVQQRHQSLDIRVGFVFYRDEGDDYVTRTIAFDRDFGRAQGVLARQYAGGGGDYPEAMDQAMIRAVGQDWRPDAVKSLLLVADAPPHDDKFGRTWAATEAARAKRIQIIPLAASGVADEAEYAMRAMAALTQSRYIFLTDDSGIGNAHAAPAVDCYLVTRLDALVRRVLDSQISGRRVEPGDDEVIRTVGQYDAGKCVLPADFGRGQQ